MDNDIDPNKILLDTGVDLSSWQYSGDPTEIDGARLHSLAVDKLAAGSLGIDVTMDTGGFISAFTGTWDSDATGWRLTKDEIEGQNSGTTQVLLSSSTGKLTAGGGVVIIDSDGISIEITTDYADSRAYRFVESGGALRSVFEGYENASINSLRVSTKDVTGKDSQAILLAHAPSGEKATSQLEAEATSGIFARAVADGSTLTFEIGETGGGATTKVYTTSGDIRTDGGLFVGATDVDPDADDIWLDGDIRAVGGIYVGSRGTDPDEDDIHFDGNLKSEKTTTHDVYAFHPLTTQATSASWDGDSKAADSDGTIDLSSAFSLPTEIVAVAARLVVKDESVGVNCYLGPSSGEANVGVTTQVADTYVQNSGPVACDGSGDIYWATDGELDEVYIQIYGYWI